MTAVSDPDLSRLLLESHRALSSELIAGLAERGYPDLRPGHAAVFLHVDRRSGTRLTELARRARMTKQGMMLLIDDLEGRGYVRRVPDPVDARAKVVKLTAHGRRAATETRRTVQALETRTRRSLGERRFEAFREALDQIVSESGGG
jgi:DNA-binding MarR family transcriptional regulator